VRGCTIAKFKRLFSVIIVIALLLSSGILFITTLATADNGEGGVESKAEPEEITPSIANEVEVKLEKISSSASRGQDNTVSGEGTIGSTAEGIASSVKEER